MYNLSTPILRNNLSKYINYSQSRFTSSIEQKIDQLIEDIKLIKQTTNNIQNKIISSTNFMFYNRGLF